MDTLMTQKKERVETNQRVWEVGFETCPACCGKRKPENLVCWNCKKGFDDGTARAENNGGIVIMNLFQWAYANAKKNLSILEDEFFGAMDERKRLISQVRQAVKNDLVAKGIAFVDSKDFKQRMYEKFIELFGEVKSKEISKIVNINPQKIASLKRLIASQEEKMQQSQNIKA